MRLTTLFIFTCFILFGIACDQEEFEPMFEEEISMRTDTAYHGDPGEFEDHPCWDGVPNVLRVLFIGNSFTANYTVDIPTMFHELAIASGKNISTVAKSVVLGHTLNQHLGNGTTQNLVDQGDWDYVVLQENSGFLANASGAGITFKNSVSSFIPLIKNTSPAAKILLYQVVPPVSHTDPQYTNLENDWNDLFDDVASLHSDLSVTKVSFGFTLAYNSPLAPGIVGGVDILRLPAANQFHFLNAGGLLTAAAFYSDIFNDKPCVPDEMTFWLGGSNTGLANVNAMVQNLDEILQMGYIAGINSTPYIPSDPNCPHYAMYTVGNGPC